MAYRVVHCGTGYVGKNTIRLLLRQPDLELVGHHVHDPAKAGQDSGELAGVGPIGVKATNSWAEVIALEPDVVTYCFDTMQREREALEELLPLLEAGINVVSLSTWRLGHPTTMPADLLQRFESACRRTGASAYLAGHDPGWTTSELPIATLALAGRVDCIRVTGFACYRPYTAEYAARDYFGFGQPPGFRPALIEQGEVQWGSTLHRIAEVMGVEIDGFRTLYDTESLDHDLECGFGVVKAGTAAVTHFELQALSKGRPFAIIEHVNRLVDDPHQAGRQWTQPKSAETSTRIEVTGEPSYALELHGQHTAWCSTPILNVIPAVVAAKPGILRPQDLPPIATRDVTAKVGPWP
jgi:hypothetical protein